jgi:hypothetical protein
MAVNALLADLGSLILAIPQNIVSDIVGAKIEEAQLAEFDRKLREYLREHVQEYDYDQIDSYFSAEGLYATPKSGILSEEVLASFVNDFFSKHTDLISNILSITPIIRSAIQYAHTEMYKHLSIGEKALYQQSNAHHESLSTSIAEAKALFASGFNKNADKTIELSAVSRLYETAIESIKAGRIEAANDLLSLLPEFNLSPDGMSYYLSLKLEIDFFISSSFSNADLLRFIKTHPSQLLLHNLVSFLFQVQEHEYLTVLLPSITDQNIRDLIEIATSDHIHDSVRNRLVNGTVIYPRFLDYEATYWFIGHYEMSIYRFSVAEDFFSQLWAKFENIWASYNRACSAISNILFQSGVIVHLNSESYECLKRKLSDLANYSSSFSYCSTKMVRNFWGFFLNAASHLRRIDFLALAEQVPISIKSDDVFSSADFQNQLGNAVIIEPLPFWLYCDRTNDEKLVYQYLASAFDAMDYSEVKAQLQSRQAFVRSNPLIAELFLSSIYFIDGTAEALSLLENLAPFYVNAAEYLILCAIVLNLCNEKSVEDILTEAFKKTTELDVSDLSTALVIKLARLLEKYTRTEDAIYLLKMYSAQSDPLLFELLSLLIKSSDAIAECAEIIEKLLAHGFEHPLVYYYRGIINDNKLGGSGLIDFEKSFGITRSIQSAYSSLASRILSGKAKNDEILKYATHSENAELLAIAAQTYQKLRLPDQQYHCVLKSLLRSEDGYNKKIFGYFFMCSIDREKSNVERIDSISENTVVYLFSENNSSELVVCLHQESDIVPSSSPEFAGCFHTNSLDTDFLRLQYHKVGDNVIWRSNPYKVVKIENRDAFLARYCIRKMMEQKDVQTLSSDSAEGLMKQLNDFEILRNDEIEKALKQYESADPGLPISLLARNTGKTIMETIGHLINSNLPFLAGLDYGLSGPPYIVSATSIYVLGLLDVSNATSGNCDIALVTHHTRKLILDECDMITGQLSKTKGVFWSENGNPRFHAYTDEVKAQINNNVANVIDLLSRLSSLEELKVEEYASEILEIKEAIGNADFEAISCAKSKEMVLIADDQLIRALAHYAGVTTSTSIQLLVRLNLGYNKTIDCITKLLKAHYVFPLTRPLLEYLSDQFSSMIDREDELEKISIETTSMLKMAVDDDFYSQNIIDHFLTFLSENRQVNETLKFFLLHSITSVKNKELQQMPQIEEV